MKVKEGVHDAFDDPRLVRVMFVFVYVTDSLIVSTEFHSLWGFGLI